MANDYRWFKYFDNVSAQDLYADRSPHFPFAWNPVFDEDSDEWGSVESYCIYGLFDPRNYCIFYVGQSTNITGRIRDHLYGGSGSNQVNNIIHSMALDGFKPGFTILGEIVAPSRYADKLEFMYIVNAGALSPIPIMNKKYKWFIGKIIYWLDDFKLLYSCIGNRIPFAEYQEQSFHLHKSRREMINANP